MTTLQNGPVGDSRSIRHPGVHVFRLLDPSLDHTCAAWIQGDDLDRAHRRAIDALSTAARVGNGGRVLELGNRWGTTLARVSDGAGVDPTEAFDRLDLPLAARPVDAVIGVQGIEHLATPQQALAGEHMRVFRSFFQKVHAWTVPGAWFALQTITAARLPRRAAVGSALTGITDELPLWRRCGRVEEIVKACGAVWEVRELDSRHDDGMRTFQEWLSRLSNAEAAVRAQYGDERYEAWAGSLTDCLRAFAENHLTLIQFALRRID